MPPSTIAPRALRGIRRVYRSWVFKLKNELQVVDCLANVLGTVLTSVPSNIFNDIAGQEPYAVGDDVLDRLNGVGAIMCAAFLNVCCFHKISN